MIRLRVEWHHKCRDCGTQLVVDYFDYSEESCVCPWCGCVIDSGSRPHSDELTDYITESIRELEDRANGTTRAII